MPCPLNATGPTRVVPVGVGSQRVFFFFFLFSFLRENIACDKVEEIGASKYMSLVGSPVRAPTTTRITY